MTKQDIIDALRGKGIAFDPAASKTTLEELLIASTDTTATVVAEMMSETEIEAKIRAGLDRDQAIEVINAQRKHEGKKPLSAAELKAAGADAGDLPEEEIEAKIRAGLDRDQAIEVIRNNHTHQAAQKKGV